MTDFNVSTGYSSIDGVFRISNTYLDGNWPNIIFHFDTDFYWNDRGGYGSLSGNIGFYTNVYGYEEDSGQYVSWSGSGMHGPYGHNYFNPGLGNRRSISLPVAFRTNAPNKLGYSSTCNISSPVVEEATQVSLTLLSVSENSIKVSHKFLNKRNFWFLRLFDKDKGTYWELSNNTGNGETLITGLKPNQTYHLRLQAVGRDGSKTSSYADCNATTLGKSSIGNAVNIMIGSPFALQINGYDDGFTHTISFRAGGYSFQRLGLARGAHTITLSEEECTALYAQMTTTTKKELSVSLETFVKGVSIGSTSVSGEVKISIPDNLPELQNFLYEDISEEALGITNNPAYVLQNISKLRVYDIVAKAKHGATVLKYRLDVSDKSYENNEDQIITEAITKSGSLSLKVMDSRSLEGSLEKSFHTFIPYAAPILHEVEVIRKNGVETTSILNVEGSYSLLMINDINKNDVIQLTYRYRESTTSKWSEFYSVQPTIVDGKISFHNIITDFNVDKSYHFEVKLQDRLRSAMVTTTLIAGTPSISIRKQSVGIGKVPLEGRTLDVNGEIFSMNSRLAKIDEAFIYRHDLRENENLDAMKEEGYYHQHNASTATRTLNYPINEAGLLKVINRDSIYQTYTMATGGSEYQRTCMKGKWSNWKQVKLIDSSVSNDTPTLIIDSKKPGCRAFKYPDGYLVCIEYSSIYGSPYNQNPLWCINLPIPPKHIVPFVEKFYTFSHAINDGRTVISTQIAKINTVDLTGVNNAMYVYCLANQQNGFYANFITLGRWK